MENLVAGAIMNAQPHARPMVSYELMYWVFNIFGHSTACGLDSNPKLKEMIRITYHRRLLILAFKATRCFRSCMSKAARIFHR
jgi:hypothetical protein